MAVHLWLLLLCQPHEGLDGEEVEEPIEEDAEN